MSNDVPMQGLSASDTLASFTFEKFDFPEAYIKMRLLHADGVRILKSELDLRKVFV